MSVILLATLDTKGHEIAFVRDRLHELGLCTRLVDAGCQGAAAVAADVTREELFAAAGTTLAAMRDGGDRGVAVAHAAAGARALVAQWHAAGQVEGILGIGGSAGTTIATAAMRALPLGVPKVMVSTVASGDVRGFVGAKDILMLASVVDIAGLNRISRVVLGEAAAALAGMVQHRQPDRAPGDRPTIAASMFGVTTPCVDHARLLLEREGYEVIVFHATGAGGQAMESLIDEGMIAGVLDITTTELADELVGGVLSAGPDRLRAAARMGLPQVVSVGATDMVNFRGIETVPAELSGRNLYRHNANVTLMRTTAAECREIGQDIGRKLAAGSAARTAVLLPARGVSAIDRAGQPFDDPAARAALFAAIRENSGSVPVIERDEHINDPEFAAAAVAKLLELLR